MLLLLILSLLPGLAQARTLTFPECVALTSQNNPDLEVARANLEAAKAQVKVSYGNFVPSLSGSIGANYEFANSVLPDSVTGQVNKNSALTLNYNLFGGFRDVAAVNKARANLEIAYANLQSAEARISDRLRQAFVRFGYAQNYTKLTDTIIGQRSQNAVLVKAQYQSGRENQGSYLLAESRLEQARFDHLQALHNEVLSQVYLANVLGSNETDLTIAGTPPRTTPPENPIFHELVLNVPSHISQVAQIKSTDADVTTARSGFLPSLDLTSQLINRNHILYTNQNQEVTVGLSLTIPIFNGLKTLFGLESSVQLRKAAELGLSSQDFSILDDIRTRYFAYQEADQYLRVSDVNLNAVKVQEQIVKKQYNNGITNFENWDIIENNLVNAQKSYLNSDRDRDFAESAWRLSIGKGDF